METFIFHHNDLDGFVSREIARKYVLQETGDEPICREINYGMEFNHHDIDFEEDQLIIVDFCLQPHTVMIETIKKFQDNLIWIDHHKTSVELLEEHPELQAFNFGGKIENEKIAACEMCWKYFFPEQEVPKQVRLISQYDVWHRSGEFNWDDVVVPFKMWAESIEIDQDFLKPMSETEFSNRVTIGKSIAEHNNVVDKSIVLENAHRIKLKFKGDKRELSTIVLNSGKKGSRQFTSAYSERKFDLMLSYRNTKGKYWTIGLYSVKEHVDCSEIAKIIGSMGPFGPGGGHKGAAGCQVDTATLIKLLNL